jgi:DNA-binding LytR/AlgR family response regulator
MIRSYAVDDQIKSLEVLKGYIAETPEIQLIRSFTNSVTALKEISQSGKVDVIFLDIDMPNISGIELASQIRNKCSKLIFTTSHAKYAIDAFDVLADAYLLKPYSYSKFAFTINRLFFENPTMELPPKKEEFFFVKNKEQDHMAVSVKYADIVAFESFHNYVKIHTTQKIIIAYLSLKDVKEQLHLDEKFIQIHRAFIISTAHISSIDGFRINLSNGLGFSVGESYKSEFKESLTNKIVISSRRK